MRTVRRHSRSGFTLLELLLATLAFAVVIAALNTAFYSSLRLREGSERRSLRDRPREEALETLRRDLQSAFHSERFVAGRFRAEPVTDLGVPSCHLILLTRTGVLEAAETWPDIQQVEYYLAPPEDPEAAGLDLVRAVTRNILPEVLPEPEEERLVPGVGALGFLFHDGVQWLESWDPDLQETDRMPRWVSVRMEFVSTNRSPAALPEVLSRVIPIRTEPVVGEEEAEDDGSATGGGDR